MTDLLGELDIVVRARLDQLDKDLATTKSKTSKAVDEVGADIERRLGDKMASVGKTLTKTLTPAAVGMGAAFGVAFKQFDDGADAIVAKSGLAGKALNDATASMKTIGGQVNASLGQIGAVIGDIASAAQLTGAPLEAVSKRIVELSKLGQTLSGADVGQFLKNWGISADQAAPALDRLFAASQKSGVPIAEIMRQVTDAGPVLREFGLGWDQAAGFIANMASKGIDASEVFRGMSKAIVAQNKDLQELGKVADKAAEERDKAIEKYGVGSKQALEASAKFEEAQQRIAQAFKSADVKSFLADAVEGIRSAGTEASANAIAIDVFGAKAGPQLAAKIREGSVTLADLSQNILPEAQDQIGKTYKATVDWGDKLGMLTNRLIGAVGPIGEYGLGIAGIAAGVGPLLTAGGKLISFFVAQGVAASGASTATTGVAGAEAAAGIAGEAAAPGLGAFALGLWAVLAPIALVVAGAGLLAAVVYVVATNWDWLAAHLDAVIATIGVLFFGPFAFAIAFVVNQFDWIRDTAVTVWNGVSAAVEDFIGFFSGLPGRIASIASGMWDPIWNAFRGVINTVIRAWNNLGIPGFSISIPMPGPIPDISFSWGGLSLPDIPMLAKGGIATSPTLAMLAENNRPEAVVPLDRLGDLAGDGRAMRPYVVNYYIRGSVLAEKELLELTRNGIDRVGRHNVSAGVKTRTGR